MHGGKRFEVLVSESGDILLCLHQWGDHLHPTMIDRNVTPGNGLILYFRTGILQQIHDNAIQAGADIVEDMHLNRNSTKLEFSLRDPDGYYITITEFHLYDGQ